MPVRSLGEEDASWVTKTTSWSKSAQVLYEFRISWSMMLLQVLRNQSHIHIISTHVIERISETYQAQKPGSSRKRIPI